MQNICASLDALRLRRGSLKFLFYKGASEPCYILLLRHKNDEEERLKERCDDNHKRDIEPPIQKHHLPKE